MRGESQSNERRMSMKNEIRELPKCPLCDGEGRATEWKSWTSIGKWRSLEVVMCVNIECLLFHHRVPVDDWLRRKRDIDGRIEAYVAAAGGFSVATMMRKIPEYWDLIECSKALVPHLLKRLSRGPSMPVILLLEDIVGKDGPGVEMTTADASEAWLRWGMKESLIE